MSYTNSYDDFKHFLTSLTLKETVDNFDFKNDDSKIFSDKLTKIIDDIEELYNIETLHQIVEDYLYDIDMAKRARQYFDAVKFIYALMNEDDYTVYLFHKNTFKETKFITNIVRIDEEGVVKSDDGYYIVKKIS